MAASVLAKNWRNWLGDAFDSPVKSAHRGKDVHLYSPTSRKPLPSPEMVSRKEWLGPEACGIEAGDGVCQ